MQPSFIAYLKWVDRKGLENVYGMSKTKCKLDPHLNRTLANKHWYVRVMKREIYVTTR